MHVNPDREHCVQHNQMVFKFVVPYIGIYHPLLQSLVLYANMGWAPHGARRKAIKSQSILISDLDTLPRLDIFLWSTSVDQELFFWSFSCFMIN